MTTEDYVIDVVVFICWGLVLNVGKDNVGKEKGILVISNGKKGHEGVNGEDSEEFRVPCDGPNRLVSLVESEAMPMLSLNMHLRRQSWLLGRMEHYEKRGNGRGEIIIRVNCYGLARTAATKIKELVGVPTFHGINDGVHWEWVSVEHYLLHGGSKQWKGLGNGWFGDWLEKWGSLEHWKEFERVIIEKEWEKRWETVLNQDVVDKEPEEECEIGKAGSLNGGLECICCRWRYGSEQLEKVRKDKKVKSALFKLGKALEGIGKEMMRQHWEAKF